MLESLISSKTRVKLLTRFFVNPERAGYLRALAAEFNESTNAVRVELNRLEGAGILTSSTEGNKKIFNTNAKHPLYAEMRNMVLKHVGIDAIIDNVVSRLGDVQQVFVVGDLALGLDNKNIDLIVVGNVDETYLASLCKKAENLVKRSISYKITHLEDEISDEALLVWSNKSEKE
jgi:hypothetical protein